MTSRGIAKILGVEHVELLSWVNTRILERDPLPEGCRWSRAGHYDPEDWMNYGGLKDREGD